MLLRPWAAADVPGEIMRFAHPSVTRFSWPHARPYTEEDARAFFIEQERARELGTDLNLAFAEPAQPGDVLGGGSLYGLDDGSGRAAVGFWLAPEARRRGIATRATRLLARWAFAELHVARLELTCAPENDASQRVAERCGFVREGLLRSYVPFKGGRRDSVMFSLLAQELHTA
ncbi:MAG: GNAT family protein [Solirubrobacteraceae bacterium]